MIAEGQTFYGRRVYLDGGSFYNCRFENCILIYAGAIGTHIENPQFINCSVELQGAGRSAMRLLQVLYQIGAGELAENIIREVRGGGAGATGERPKDATVN